MNQKTKKLIILNLPYAIIGLFCSNIGEAWRIAEGTDISTKLLGFFTSMGNGLKYSVHTQTVHDSDP